MCYIYDNNLFPIFLPRVNMFKVVKIFYALFVAEPV